MEQENDQGTSGRSSPSSWSSESSRSVVAQSPHIAAARAALAEGIGAGDQHPTVDLAEASTKFMEAIHDQLKLVLNTNAGFSAGSPAKTNDEELKFPAMTQATLVEYLDKMKMMLYSYVTNTFLPVDGRLVGLQALALISSPSALELLSVGLGDESKLMRIETVTLLGLSGISDAIPMLGYVLDNKEEFYLIRRLAAEYLSEIGKPECSGFLMRHVDDDVESIRNTCVNGVQNMLPCLKTNNEGQKSQDADMLLPDILEAISLNDRNSPH